MDFNSLQSLALNVGEALTLDEVFQRIVQGLAAQSEVALARVWLVLPGDLCECCVMRAVCPDPTRCLHLVASAGTPLGATEDWSRLDGYFRRIPLNASTVGSVGALGEPILIGQDLPATHWVSEPEWALREQIASFAGQPLVYRGDTLGVLAVFSRAGITPKEFDWLRIFADHAAIAIAHARAFAQVGRLRRQQAQDIAGLRRAEAVLRNSEARYRHIFRTAAVSIWEEDFSAVKVAVDELKAEGVTDFRAYVAAHPEFVLRAISLVKVIDVNDATLTLFQARSKEELLGALPRILLPETQGVFAEELIAIAEGRATFESEAVLQTLEGRRLSVLFTIAFPPESSALDSVLVTIMDVTERKRLDNQLRRTQAHLIAAQEMGSTGSWARRISTGELFWSEEVFRIFGLDPRMTRPLREVVRQCFHPDDREFAIRTIDEAVREKRPYVMDVRIVRPDGAVRHVHVRGQPVFDENGETDEFIGVVMDITDRKRTERALRRARERGLEARFAAVLEERSRLARDMHDTLLQGFTGLSLKLLAVTNRAGGSPEQVAALRDLVGLAQKTLTDARRAVWNLRSPVPAAGDFPAALRTVAEDCVRGTRLELEYDPGGLPRTVDPEIEPVVIRVLQEALANVVKHAEARTVRVRLLFQARRLRLSITDDGRGFALASDAHVLGHHLGLLGMRERASQVRGRLLLRSAPGQGTRVVLLVPYTIHRSLHRSA